MPFVGSTYPSENSIARYRKLLICGGKRFGTMGDPCFLPGFSACFIDEDSISCRLKITYSFAMCTYGDGQKETCVHFHVTPTATHKPPRFGGRQFFIVINWYRRVCHCWLWLPHAVGGRVEGAQ